MKRRRDYTSLLSLSAVLPSGTRHSLHRASWAYHVCSRWLMMWVFGSQYQFIPEVASLLPCEFCVWPWWSIIWTNIQTSGHQGRLYTWSTFSFPQWFGRWSQVCFDTGESVQHFCHTSLSVKFWPFVFRYFFHSKFQVDNFFRQDSYCTLHNDRWCSFVTHSVSIARNYNYRYITVMICYFVCFLKRS